MSTLPVDPNPAAKRFEAVIKQAPRSSAEYWIYSGKGLKLKLQSIVYRIGYLQNRAPHLSLDYKIAAIAYLNEELEKRRQQSEPPH